MNFDEKEEQNMAQNIIGERIAGLVMEQNFWKHVFLNGREEKRFGL